MVRTLISSILFLFLIACKSNENKQESSVIVEQAVWYNWTGGQPGVGGTNYELTIKTKGGLLSVSSLIIDQQSLPASIEEKGDNLYMIRTSENRSVLDESIPRMDRRPNFRTTQPESCQLTLLIDDAPVTLEINDFEKGSSKNYP